MIFKLNICGNAKRLYPTWHVPCHHISVLPIVALHFCKPRSSNTYIDALLWKWVAMMDQSHKLSTDLIDSHAMDQLEMVVRCMQDFGGNVRIPSQNACYGSHQANWSSWVSILFIAYFAVRRAIRPFAAATLFLLWKWMAVRHPSRSLVFGIQDTPC